MMTRSTSTPTAIPGLATPADTHTSEGLRCLLCRLHDQGPDAWAQDPAATELMEYVCEKHAALAAKHRLDPWEAASAAFDAMRTRSVREADDPWAVVTHAVRITCIYEERAQGLLCSVHQARRAQISVLNDPERFTGRAFPIVNDHPVFAVTEDRFDQLTKDEPEASTLGVDAAVDASVKLLVLLGWPPDSARGGVEHICDALSRTGSRSSAFEALRREQQSCVLLDVPPRSWRALLRALLGTPDRPHAATSSGRGVLIRLLIGETIPALLADDDLVLALSVAAPGLTR